MYREAAYKRDKATVSKIKPKLPKFKSEIAHAYHVLDPTRITAQISDGAYVGDVNRPIHSASLNLYFDKSGQTIQGMSHYYRITFWSGCNGVEITKGNSKSIAYYGFVAGDTKSSTHDFRNFGIPYENAIKYGENNKFNGENLWFWHGCAMWEDLPFDEILQNLVLKSWNVYTPNVSPELNLPEGAKRARIEQQNVINLAFKRRFVRCLEFHDLITPGLIDIPPIDFSKWDELWLKSLEYRRKYVEMYENGTIPDDFEYNPNYPYW